MRPVGREKAGNKFEVRNCARCHRRFVYLGGAECRGCTHRRFQFGDIVKRVVTPGESPLLSEYPGHVVLEVRDDGGLGFDGGDVGLYFIEPTRFTLIGCIEPEGE
jgi:hypothetical protein